MHNQDINLGALENFLSLQVATSARWSLKFCKDKILQMIIFTVSVGTKSYCESTLSTSCTETWLLT